VQQDNNEVGAKPGYGSADNTTDTIVVRTDEESITKGKKLFEKVCQKCHDAYSTTPATGPGLKGILKGDVLPISKKPATGENILNQLDRPFEKMPSFHFLSDEMKLNISAFLNTL
jgi:cytochrome c1